MPRSLVQMSREEWINECYSIGRHKGVYIFVIDIFTAFPPTHVAGQLLQDNFSSRKMGIIGGNEVIDGPDSLIACR